MVKIHSTKDFKLFLERMLNTFQASTRSSLSLPLARRMQVGNRVSSVSGFRFQNMSRSGEGGLETQGHFHLPALTGSQLAVVSRAAMQRQKQWQSMEPGGSAGCSPAGKLAKRAMRMPFARQQRVCCLGCH